MGQVFLSYASADRDRAKRLAEAMQRQGHQVWWDRQIAPGQTFDDVIESALNRAKCVVVLWSATSVKSDWVKTEASEAASRRMLVPALIDNVRIPLEFRRLQAADLTRWEGGDDDPEFRKFLRAVELEVRENELAESSEAAAALGIGSTSRTPGPATLISRRGRVGPGSAPERQWGSSATLETDSSVPLAKQAGQGRVPTRALAALLVAVVVAIAGLMLWLNRGTGVVTPDVVGMSYEDAAAALTAAALTPERHARISDNAAPGTIVEQSPPAGTALARAATVSVTVAEPAPAPVQNASAASVPAPAPVAPLPVEAPVAIPDLRGQTLERAIELLAAANLTLGVKKEVASNDVSLGSIVSQAPEPAQTLAKGAAVDVTVAARRNVPELVGLDLQQAQATLSKLGLKERVERVRAPARDADNRVVKQMPPAGTEIDTGGEALLTLTVAIVTPKRVSGGESLYRTNGQRCLQVCRDLGLRFTTQWSGATNSCTCDF